MRQPPDEEFKDVIDPDVDLGDPAQAAETRLRQWDILAGIAAGGVLGAEARYGLAEAIPRAHGAFPWATLFTNVLGCLLIGVLMVWVLEVLPPTRLVRPFLGVGILGGFTTFSTFGVDVVHLVDEHRAGLALLYVLASVVLCLAAVLLALVVGRRLFIRDAEKAAL
ncbi:MAG TPA: fluoride efflux transporter CrcB [Jatrophihabitans sp.]